MSRSRGASERRRVSVALVVLVLMATTSVARGALAQPAHAPAARAEAGSQQATTSRKSGKTSRKRKRARHAKPARHPPQAQVAPGVAEPSGAPVVRELQSERNLPEPRPEPPRATPFVPAAPAAREPVTTAPPAPAQPSVAIVAARALRPPEIDGVIDPHEWQHATPVESFTQKLPSPAAAPSERTALRVLYDDDALYVAFECEQRHSPRIAQLARRDRPTESDSVSIAIDSRALGRSAFEFSLSAAGVLVDGVRYDDGHISREWDAVWNGAVQTHEGGWTAELRIPLQALRFEPADVQAWGFQARRYVAALQESDEWAYVPPDAGGEVSHYGRLENLRKLDASAIELQPFVLGRAIYQGDDPAIVRRGLRFEPSAGLDFAWHPTSNVALDGTINPDFAQVEADQLILNLGTTELQFPEKRPFFLAGMDDFVTVAPIFYSRRIGRTPKPPPLASSALGRERLYDHTVPAPIYGALKLAGDSSDGWNLAALTAVTGAALAYVQQSPAGLYQTRLLAPVTSYSVLRARTALAPHLDLGAMITATVRNEPEHGWAPGWITSRGTYPAIASSDGSAPLTQRCPQGEVSALGERCFHDAYVGALDLVWTSPSGNYAIRSQGYGSAIENGPTRTLPDGTRIAAGDVGAGGTLRLSKRAGTLLLDGSVAAESRRLDFDDLGYMPRQNDARGGLYAELRTLDPWLFLNETHTSALVYAENNLDGLALGRGALLTEHLVFTSHWTFTLGGYATAARFDDREVGDGTALQRAALLGSAQAVSTDPTQPLYASAQVAEERMDDGENFSAQLSVVFRPVPSAELQLTPGYTYNNGEPRYVGTGATLDDRVFGRLFAQSASLTLRASYAFTPTLTLQSYAQAFFALGQYSDFTHLDAASGDGPPIVRLAALVPTAAPPSSPDFERASLALNVVLRWEYHTGSALYLLYVRSQDPEIVLRSGELPRLDPGRLRSLAATDVLMLKLSYWLG